MEDGKTAPLISVVVPCYNEQDVLPLLAPRLRAVTGGLKEQGLRVELIFIDDGSTDGTLAFLESQRESGFPLHIISLARNFGHQLAMTAGLDAAKGDAVILIDADLQDPPEVIPDLIAKWKEGFDVVYATRQSRAGESCFKRFSARLFYRLLNLFSKFPIPVDTGDFRLMSRAVLDVLTHMPEHNRYLRGMISWVGMQQTSILYQREKRGAGQSKYSLAKMFFLALDGLFSFSIRPLRFAISLGLFSAFLGLCGIFYALYVRFLTHSWVEGWAGLIIAILFMGGIQLFTIGILGEYIGRIYTETKQRPLYVVRKRSGFGGED